MTAQEIIDEVRQICQETDPNNTHASDSVILGWINACTISLCSWINTLPKVAVTGQVAAATLTFPTNLLRLDYASMYDGTSTYYPLETIDFVNFVRLNPDWENQAVGQPDTLVRMTDLTWKMYPPPDSTWTGKTLSIYGSVHPTALTSVNSSPDISVVMHPVYPHYCAWKFFLLLNNPERAAAEYATYDGLRRQNLRTTTSTIGSQLSLKMRGM